MSILKRILYIIVSLLQVVVAVLFTLSLMVSASFFWIITGKNILNYPSSIDHMFEEFNIWLEGLLK